MNKSKTFTCVDAAAFMTPVLGFKPGMKSLARALSHLCKNGDVRVKAKLHRSGESFAVNVYARGDGPKQKEKPTALPPEVPGLVKDKPLGPNHRRVTFGLDWKPYREPRSDRPWRGYQSGLARI